MGSMRTHRQQSKEVPYLLGVLSPVELKSSLDFLPLSCILGVFAHNRFRHIGQYYTTAGRMGLEKIFFASFFFINPQRSQKVPKKSTFQRKFKQKNIWNF
jgi:hypothetical protein